MRDSKKTSIGLLSALLALNAEDLTEDPAGRKLPDYLRAPRGGRGWRR